jgi:hypothetical protein
MFQLPWFWVVEARTANSEKRSVLVAVIGFEVCVGHLQERSRDPTQSIPLIAIFVAGLLLGLHLVCPSPLNWFC